MPKVNPGQQIIWVWPCTIRPDTAATQVSWWPECSTTQGQCRTECSQTPRGCIRDSDKVNAGHCIHQYSLAIIIWWQIFDSWSSLETSHWSLESLVAISRSSCVYTICVAIAWRSICQNQSTYTRSCKSWFCLMLLYQIYDIDYAPK